MKTLLIISLIILNLYASKPKITLDSSETYNASTVLIEFYYKKEFSDLKLTFNKLNINFKKNPFKDFSHYALIPISYYTKISMHKIIISYVQNNKRIFTSKNINIIKGTYKSEVINVPKKRVSLNKKDAKRAKIEYKEAGIIYNKKSKKLFWKEDFLNPLKSKITSNFGTKRVYNGKLKSYHSGVDFKAKKGTKILASNAGIVVISQNRFYAGNSIVLDHGNGIYTGYYHLSKLSKKVGQLVQKGEVVGLSGSSGRVTGPHLHFSTKVNGITVDPLQLISVLNKLN